MTQQEEIALAEKYGATYEPDAKRGRGWMRFQLNGWEIWQFARSGKGVFWQCAQIINMHYSNHTPQDSLEEAFEFAASTY